MVQRFELTGSLCDNKTGVVRRHRSACMQDSDARVREALLWRPRKSVTRCSKALGVETSTHTIMLRDSTLYPYRIQVAQMLTAVSQQRRREYSRDFLQFVHQHPTALLWLWFKDEVHFHLNE